MNLQAVYHQPKSNYCYAYNDKIIHIRIRAAQGDLSKVVLIYGDKFAWNKHREISMKYACSEGLFDYFSIEIPLMQRLAYYFKVTSGSEVFYYTQWGIVSRFDEKQTHFYWFVYPYIHKNCIHNVPDWVKDSVFYEIFPDRFRNGNQGNDPENVEAWGGKCYFDSFFGGDLDGIIEKIAYLKDLGVNAIYMTPIFKSLSNHKYDTIDYFTIDPHFGDLRTLKKLVSICHENGIRVILDGVFNHCSSQAVQFKHVLEQGSASPYCKWFYLNGFPVTTMPPNYKTFSTVSEMPKLNTENKEVRDYLLSAVRYWTEQTDIDGWRLDVADELDPKFLRELRENVKQCKEDAYILGEVWQNASPWLMGDQLDAVMNYRFTMACLNYFALDNVNAKEFTQLINKIQMDYTQQSNEVMFNLLDSHDTSRFLTQCGGNIRKLLLAVTFQLTYTGAPCIYYGTETGMEGGEDPDCRRTFIWDKSLWNMEVYQYVRKLIHIRRDYIALRQGTFIWIENDDNVIAYERKLPNQIIIAIINNDEEKKEVKINIGKNTFTDLITKKKYDFAGKSDSAIIVPGFSAILLLG
ncbi:MAG TPA: glycoside hydrolase family 13 protein [Caproicibacter sp.]|nr:glycoside hydrolase family 13 protein [Caproicibacter sp.]